jgi:hypothetical protein
VDLFFSHRLIPRKCQGKITTVASYVQVGPLYMVYGDPGTVHHPGILLPYLPHTHFSNIMIRNHTLRYLREIVSALPQRLVIKELASSPQSGAK